MLVKLEVLVYYMRCLCYLLCLELRQAFFLFIILPSDIWLLVICRAKKIDTIGKIDELVQLVTFPSNYLIGMPMSVECLSGV